MHRKPKWQLGCHECCASAPIFSPMKVSAWADFRKMPQTRVPCRELVGGTWSWHLLTFISAFIWDLITKVTRRRTDSTEYDTSPRYDLFCWVGMRVPIRLTSDRNRFLPNFLSYRNFANHTLLKTWILGRNTNIGTKRTQCLRKWIAACFPDALHVQGGLETRPWSI